MEETVKAEFKDISKSYTYSIDNDEDCSDEIDEDLDFEDLSDNVLSLVYKTKEKVNYSLTKFTPGYQKSLIKGLVSKNKNRFQYEGFDLDLTYILENIIAMGFPAASLESIYRNNVKDVIKFFETRHNNHYRVYNLCSERSYPENTFQTQVSYGFDDHEAPPINLIYPFCKDVKDWVKSNPENIAAIHCMAGKGRTGLLICCYLLYRGIFKKADEAIRFFGLMRVSNGKGLTVPSQIRYVYYFESILKEEMGYPLDSPKMLLSKIKFHTIPNICKGGETYFIVSCKDEKQESTSLKYQLKNDQATFDFPGKQIVVGGDVRIVFYVDYKLTSKNKIFKLWFNTNFIPENGALIIEKPMLDWACKDKDHKFFDSNFKIEIQLISIENI